MSETEHRSYDTDFVPVPRLDEDTDDSYLLHQLLADLDGRAVRKRQAEIQAAKPIELPQISAREWGDALRADFQANLIPMVAQLWKKVFPGPMDISLGNSTFTVKSGSAWRATDNSDLPELCPESESSEK